MANFNSEFNKLAVMVKKKPIKPKTMVKPRFKSSNELINKFPSRFLMPVSVFVRAHPKMRRNDLATLLLRKIESGNVAPVLNLDIEYLKHRITLYRLRDKWKAMGKVRQSYYKHK